MLIDACHSGVALGALHKWRDDGPEPSTELAALQARRSRRVITSALDDQRAMDGGPSPGHSLFTGCLIEAFSGGLAEGGRRVATGRELGMYLHKRVRAYPPSTQTPDFGTFELDDRGDIVVPALTASGAAAATSPVTAGAAMSSSARRAWIGRRVAIGVAAGALVAVLALVLAFRGGGGGPGTATIPTDGGGSSEPRAVAAAPTEPTPAAQIGASNIVDAAQRAALASPTDAPLGPVGASLAEATRSSPAQPTPPPAGTLGGGSSPRDRVRVQGPVTESPPVPRTKPPAPTPGAQPPIRATDPATPASKCSKAGFAAVYEAAAPTPSVVNTALRRLKSCRDAGLVTTHDFDRYQTALVNKLVNKL